MEVSWMPVIDYLYLSQCFQYSNTAGFTSIINLQLTVTVEITKVRILVQLSGLQIMLGMTEKHVDRRDEKEE